jgi:aspartyl-tRNA(Asn)/glutamyl-tRNA(Gln) amidotransferase subunit B
MDKYELVIGREIHVELKTKSKMFCQCSADYFGKEPNTNTCPVCLGMPGALPVPNRKAIEWTILLGKALGCTINKISKFDRKHYFYPDLPKGYQISQYDEPFCINGKLETGGQTFRIHRIHLEEDTGKLLHESGDTLIDFNRSSVPLVEIVTEADFRDSVSVKSFLEELYTIIKYLDISDADMEKGSMRMEPNISVRLKGQKEYPNYKVEIKNINSFRFVKQAIDFEFKRHVELLEKGETPIQETRGFDEKKVSTYSQRTKENAHDYRYFPEPDIPPLVFSEDQLKEIEKGMVELPLDKMKRFVETFNIKEQDAFQLTRQSELAKYFEDVLVCQKDDKEFPKKVINAILNKKISSTLTPCEFAQKVTELYAEKKTDEGALVISVDKVLSANPKSIEDYKSGKINAVMFLVGQVMKEMKGQADANLVKSKLEEKLKQ